MPNVFRRLPGLVGSVELLPFGQPAQKPARSPLTPLVEKSTVCLTELRLYGNEVSSMPKPKTATQKITFSYAAPQAQSVMLAGDFTGWQQAPLQLKKDKSGVWKKTISLAPGRYEYRLLVDGEWRDDPNCPHRQPNQFGGDNCVCVVNGVPG